MYHQSCGLKAERAEESVTQTLPSPLQGFQATLYNYYYLTLMRTLQRKFRTTLLAQFIHPTTAVEASFGGLHLHLKVGGLQATKSDINVLATNLESVINCAFSQDNQHDAASYSFHPRLPWSRWLIIDVDEIKAYIILHNYIDHKTR